MPPTMATFLKKFIACPNCAAPSNLQNGWPVNAATGRL